MPDTPDNPVSRRLFRLRTEPSQIIFGA